MKKILFVVACMVTAALFYTNTPTTLEEAIAQEMQDYDKKEIIHTEKLDNFAVVLSKANPDHLSTKKFGIENKILIIDIFVNNDKKGWSFLNSSREIPTSYLDDLSYFFRFLPTEKDQLITFGDINNPLIQSVEIQVADQFIPATIIEDNDGNKTFFFIHEFERERGVRGFSGDGELVYEVIKRH